MNRKEALPASVDVVVAGSGAGGMMAALVAAASGLEVLLAEASDLLGGTTAYSSGTAWIPATDHAAGFAPDTPEAALRYMQALAGPRADAKRQMAFLQAGAEAVRFIEANADIGFFAPPHAPDYAAHPDAMDGGRALVVGEFDGRRLGKDLELIRQPRPGFTILGGMMVNRADIEALLAPLSSLRNLGHVLRLLSTHFLSLATHRRSARLLMGSALVARLLFELRRRRVGIHISTAMTGLRTDETGRVCGAVLRRQGNVEAVVEARRGVILATGGFGASKRLRERLITVPDAGYNVGAPTLHGDGLILAESAGAAIDSEGHGSGAFWMPSSILTERGAELLFPHLILDRAKPGLIAVGDDGKRFVNEADSYHDFCQAMFRTGLGRERPAWLVFDRSFLKSYAAGLIRPGPWGLKRFLDAGYLLEARNLEELAAAAGISRSGLVSTVERFNGFAPDGVDRDFGKGTTSLNRHNGDPKTKPNPCMGPIGRAPFYAMPVWPATLATGAGISTDGNARALRADGSPIEGLYAVGNDMSSVMYDTYPGPGTTLGPAIVFAYLAARHAAGR